MNKIIRTKKMNKSSVTKKYVDKAYYSLSELFMKA